MTSRNHVSSSEIKGGPSLCIKIYALLWKPASSPLRRQTCIKFNTHPEILLAPNYPPFLWAYLGSLQCNTFLILRQFKTLHLMRLLCLNFSGNWLRNVLKLVGGAIFKSFSESKMPAELRFSRRVIVFCVESCVSWYSRSSYCSKVWKMIKIS